MTRGDARSRTSGTVFAAAVLIFDATVALLTSAGLFLLSLFPPVAAIEGRPPVIQQWYLPSAVALVVAIAALWAAVRAIRGIRGGRLPGIGIAVVGTVLSVGLLLGAVAAPELLAIFAGSAIAHVIAAIALVRWPDPLVGSPGAT